MIILNLSNIPVGISHQEYEWKLFENESPEHNEEVLIKARFEVNNLHKNQFEFNGSLNYSLNLICDRCNDLYIHTFEENIHFILKRHAVYEDLDIISFDTNNVNITDYIRDIVITSIPIKNICSDDCKGLCSGCGVNLNKEECKCNK